ncbi:MAG TPA: helix-turn-helix domain-containing protein [Planctomycetota bacterium]|nr:helix-turn-helix domain-containing protein [Planctomycetota bacterium]
MAPSNAASRAGLRTDPAEALVSPVRLELVERLQARGRATVAELASELDRSPHSLYHHVRRLLACGVLREDGRRKAGPREEAVFALAAERIVLPHPLTAATSRAAARSVAAVLRGAARNFRRGLEEGRIGRVGGRGEAFLCSRRGRLSPRGARRLRALVDRIERLLAEESTKGGARPYLFTAALAPTGRGRRSR